MNGNILKFKNKYRAESARRQGWDYAQAGVYFITICAKDKEMFFGEVVGNEDETRVELSEIGKIANKFWLEIPKHFPFVQLYEHIIMPNHVHGIIEICREDDGKTVVETRRGASLQYAEHKNKFGPLTKNSLSSIINHFKGNVKRYCNKNNFEFFAWQSRFYDRIIRNEDEFGKIREYIINNPLKWELDKNNPENLFM